MRKCSYCGAEYPDATAICPVDQTQLATDSSPEATKPQIEKPNVVRVATVLLCLSLAILIAEICVLWFHHSPVGGTVFSLTIMGWLTYSIDRGSNSARLTFLVLFIVGGAISIPVFLLVPAARGYVGVFVIQTVLQTIALILLFNRTARPWFRPVASQS